MISPVVPPRYLCAQWLDYATYARLAGSLCLPSYLLYSTTCVALYTVLTALRWRQPPPSRPAPRPGPPLTRTDSKAAIYHSEGEVAPPLTTPFPLLEQFGARPDLAFHVAQSCLLAALAASTLRMKCFWAPYICLLGAAGLGDPRLWHGLVARLTGRQCGPLLAGTLRRTAVLCFVLLLASRHRATYQVSFDNIRFWVPRVCRQRHSTHVWEKPY